MDTTLIKIDSAHSPRGPDGQKYLASGVRVAMRLRELEAPGPAVETRDYETVGYVLRGRAELHIEGQVVTLAPGDSYVVPRGARHAFRIRQAFAAVEATSPPSFLRGRNEHRANDGRGPAPDGADELGQLEPLGPAEPLGDAGPLFDAGDA